MSEEKAIVESIKIGEDSIYGVRDAKGDGYVVVRRVCEVLGIDDEGQRQRLLRQRWAVACMIKATGPDGKNYETFCLHVDSVPMWLATIDAGRVSPEARPKLERFQREAAQVLAEWARGRSTGAPNLDLRDIRQLAPLALQLIEVVQEQQRELAIAKPKVAYYDQVAEVEGTYSLRDIAKLFGQEHPLAFNQWLADQGLLYRQRHADGDLSEWKPYARFVHDFLVIKEVPVLSTKGRFVRTQVRVTERGKRLIFDRLLEAGLVDPQSIDLVVQ